MRSDELFLLIKENDWNGIESYLNVNPSDLNKIFGDCGSGLTPLLYAISCDNTNDGAILYLIERGASMTIVDECYKMTPLLAALFKKRKYKIVYALIYRSQFYINETCSDGRNALYMAVWMQYNSDIIKLLIDLGANIHQETTSKMTVLFKAINHPESFKVCKYLIDEGADVNALDNYGNNALVNISCEHEKLEDCPNKNLIDYLISNGINLNNHDNDIGYSIIHRVKCNYLINACVRSGVPVDNEDKQGLSPLSIAVMNNHKKKVKDLINLFHADLNHRDLELKTPLHHANKSTSDEIINVLLYHGGNLYDNENNNERPLDMILAGDFNYKYTMRAVNAVIKHVLFNNKDALDNYFKNYDFAYKKRINEFMERCIEELDKMKDLFIIKDSKTIMTFYEFCEMRKLYKNEFIDITYDQFIYKVEEVQRLFPIYGDLIIMRMCIDNKRCH